MKILDEHIRQLSDYGYAIVENFIEPELLSRAQEAMWELCPRPADYFANTDEHARLSTSQFAGLHRFPFPTWDLNRLVVNQNLIDAAEKICGTKDLELYQAEFWAKYSGAVDYEQSHHFDYGNHTLVVPKRASRHVQLAAFILLSDVSDADAPTYVVSTDSSRNTPFVPRTQIKNAFASQEVAITGAAGSALLYKTDTLHRGSNFTQPGRSRFTLLVNLQPRGWHWTGRTAWPREALSKSWSDAMVRMTPQQRVLFGFPAPDDEYWDEQTIRDVGMRYLGMDMGPYRQR